MFGRCCHRSESVCPELYSAGKSAYGKGPCYSMHLPEASETSETFSSQEQPSHATNEHQTINPALSRRDEVQVDFYRLCGTVRGRYAQGKPKAEKWLRVRIHLRLITTAALAESRRRLCIYCYSCAGSRASSRCVPTGPSWACESVLLCLHCYQRLDRELYTCYRAIATTPALFLVWLSSAQHGFYYEESSSRAQTASAAISYPGYLFI